MPSDADADLRSSSGAGPRYDIVVDLSSSGLSPSAVGRHVRRFVAIGGYTLLAGRITVGLPEHRAHDSIEVPDDVIVVRGAVAALDAALAVRDGVPRPLLIVVGTVIPTSGAVAALVRILEADRAIQSVQPRFASAAGDVVIGRPGRPGDRFEVSREALLRLPPSTEAGHRAACQLFRPGALDRVEPSDRPLETILTEQLLRSTARGERHIVDNRTVVPLPSDAEAGPTDGAIAYPPLSDPELDELDELVGRVHDDLGPSASASDVRFEALVAAGWPPRRRGRRLLVDIRGLRRRPDPLTDDAFSTLEALARCDSVTSGRWELELLADPRASLDHRVPERFPGWQLHFGAPSTMFAAAVVLMRPHPGALLELHRCARVVTFDQSFQHSGIRSLEFT